MDYQKITYTVEEGIAVIAMACKENLNALDMQMGAELLDAIRNAETNDEVKVLVIKGLERSFSAGGDVGMLHGVFESGEPMDMAAMMEKNSIITARHAQEDGQARHHLGCWVGRGSWRELGIERRFHDLRR